MRLWHYKLIPYLPKSQLLAQWRELNSIFKNQNEHILINYVYAYPKIYLAHYAELVANEMLARGYHIKSWDGYLTYLVKDISEEEFEQDRRSPHIFNEHDFNYLTICFYNLLEKYMRGQKDFTDDKWGRLLKFYDNERKKPYSLVFGGL